MLELCSFIRSNLITPSSLFFFSVSLVSTAYWCPASTTNYYTLTYAHTNVKQLTFWMPIVLSWINNIFLYFFVLFNIYMIRIYFVPISMFCPKIWSSLLVYFWRLVVGPRLFLISHLCPSIYFIKYLDLHHSPILCSF